MSDEGEGPGDDPVVEELWRRLTRNGRSEPLFSGGSDLSSRLRQLLSESSGRALAQAMIRHPEPYIPTRWSHCEAKAHAFEAEMRCPGRTPRNGSWDQTSTKR
jgi:hypothetical protein